MTLQQLFQYPALPEIALLLMTCVILLLDLFVKQKSSLLTYSATQLSLLITLGLVIHLQRFNRYIPCWETLISTCIVNCDKSRSLMVVNKCDSISRSTFHDCTLKDLT